MKTTVIEVPPEVSGFQEDKDLAKELRIEVLLPALERGERVVLDFSRVETATQSFVHALIGQALQHYGEDVLDRLDFHNCSTQLKDIIVLVVNYSLGGFSHGLDEIAIPNGEARPSR